MQIYKPSSGKEKLRWNLIQLQSKEVIWMLTSSNSTTHVSSQERQAYKQRSSIRKITERNNSSRGSKNRQIVKKRE